MKLVMAKRIIIIGLVLLSTSTESSSPSYWARSGAMVYKLSIQDNRLNALPFFKAQTGSSYSLATSHSSPHTLLAKHSTDVDEDGHRILILGEDDRDKTGRFHTIGKSPKIVAIHEDFFAALTTGPAKPNSSKKRGLLIEFFKKYAIWVHRFWGPTATRESVERLTVGGQPLQGHFVLGSEHLTDTGQLGGIIHGYTDLDLPITPLSALFVANLRDSKLEKLIVMPDTSLHLQKAFYLNKAWHVSGYPKDPYGHTEQQKLMHVDLDTDALTPVLELPTGETLLSIFPTVKTGLWLIHTGHYQESVTRFRYFNPKDKRWQGDTVEIRGFYEHGWHHEENRFILYGDNSPTILYDLNDGLLDQGAIAFQQLSPYPLRAN